MSGAALVIADEYLLQLDLYEDKFMVLASLLPARYPRRSDYDMLFAIELHGDGVDTLMRYFGLQPPTPVYHYSC